MLRKGFRTISLLTIGFLFFDCHSRSEDSLRSAQIASAPPGMLKRAPGYAIVKRECTVCHSEKLIIQNRANREGWTDTIRWMQQNQGLRTFSSEEEKEILDYLAANYSPKSWGRRPPLVVREWYVLEP